MPPDKVPAIVSDKGEMATRRLVRLSPTPASTQIATETPIAS